MFRYFSLAALPVVMVAASPTSAKTAFEHQLSIDCPSHKSGLPGKERFSYLDLALKTVHAKVDPKDSMSFKDIQAGKEPPVLTQAMIDARVDKAYAEFDKSLAECQSENDWTDDERGYARLHAINSAGLSRSQYELGSAPEETMFAHFNDEDLNQDDVDAMVDGKFQDRPVFPTIIRDLAASDWAKESYVHRDFNDPYTRALVADIYTTRMISDYMKQQFNASAEKRFGK